MPSRPLVLVTGSARRLGRTIALDLAAHGWDVAVHYRGSAAEARSAVAELRALGARAEAFAADLADEAQCQALLPAVAAALGPVDAVVNNAAHFEHDALADFGHAMMERHWRANTAPAIVLARALHAQPGERRGAVVNLLDQKLWNPNPDHLSYTLSKAGLQMATTLLAMALAPRIRVNAVAPGLTAVSGAMSAPEFEQLHRLAPLGHSSTPADIAHAVRYLLEAPAVTGSFLLVDGGQHLQPMARDIAFLAADQPVPRTTPT